jgi:hypothetical protein
VTTRYNSPSGEVGSYASPTSNNYSVGWFGRLRNPSAIKNSSSESASLTTSSHLSSSEEDTYDPPTNNNSSFGWFERPRNLSSIKTGSPGPASLTPSSHLPASEEGSFDCPTSNNNSFVWLGRRGQCTNFTHFDLLPQHNVSKNCVPLHYSDVNLTRTALASVPGSGNTWLRHLVQQTTGTSATSVLY